VTRSIALLLTLALGFSASVAMARVIDSGRAGERARIADEAPYLAPETARRLALGFGGLAADWYWLSALQYVGRKIQEEAQTGRIDLQQAV
jgi:hypothetical protein